MCLVIGVKGRRVYEYDVPSFFGPQSYSCLISELASDGLNLLRGDSKAFSNLYIDTENLCYRAYKLRAHRSQTTVSEKGSYHALSASSMAYHTG